MKLLVKLDKVPKVPLYGSTLKWLKGVTFEHTKENPLDTTAAVVEVIELLRATVYTEGAIKVVVQLPERTTAKIYWFTTRKFNPGRSQVGTMIIQRAPGD